MSETRGIGRHGLEIIPPTYQKSEKHPTPLLFVHGSWHAAWCWNEHFIPYFRERGYSAHALSLRGHGASPGTEGLGRTWFSGYVADVPKAIAQLGFDAKAVLIGHSLGGAIVQKCLEKDLAAAGVLLASVPPQGVLGSTVRFARRDFKQFVKVLWQRNLYPVIETPELAHKYLFSAGMSREQVAAYQKRLQDESFLCYLQTLLFMWWILRPRRVQVPVLVLGAANDQILIRKEMHQTARAYDRRARMERYPNMAHDMMLEAGWQLVADRIIEWLTEKGL